MSNKYNSKATQSFLSEIQSRELIKIRTTSRQYANYLENLSENEVENLENSTYVCLREASRKLHQAATQLQYAINELK